MAPGPQPVQTSRPRRPISYPTFLVYLYSALPMEWPPQQTIRFGRALKSSRRALRTTWNTALVTSWAFERSKRPLSTISFEMKTTSRSTANSCSLMPRIISPSTKAEAGALRISSLMPQACRTTSISKSR
jgi:hypothetical protein